MPSTRWNSELERQSPCRRGRGTESFPTFPHFSSRVLDSKLFAMTGYVFLAGPIGMPQDIVERVSGLMVEAGETDKIQKLLDTYGIDESAQGHIAFRRLYDSETPPWVAAVKALGLTPE